MVIASASSQRFPMALSHPPVAQVGGQPEVFDWTWQGRTYPIVYETRGRGPLVLLLPAFSTVSSRAEMKGLADRLSPEFQMVALDWLGFGQSGRPPLNYGPILYRQLLQDFSRAVLKQPVIVIAAGHGAGYVMALAQHSVPVWSKMVLLAPTWRGPLPTMGAPVALASVLCQMVRSPLIGPLLYKLNTLPSFLKLMYRRHVYTNPVHLSADFITQKWTSTQQPGARFAPAAFVTGKLDPMANRAAFLQTLEPLSIPVAVVIGEQTPPKSKAEMECLAQVPGVQTHVLQGALGIHEEYAGDVAAAILPFLRDERIA